MHSRQGEDVGGSAVPEDPVDFGRDVGFVPGYQSLYECVASIVLQRQRIYAGFQPYCGRGGGLFSQAGLSGSGQPAASLEELALCPYPMTVGQFALLTLCLQGLAAAGITMYLLELRRFCRRPMEGGVSYALR